MAWRSVFRTLTHRLVRHAVNTVARACDAASYSSWVLRPLLSEPLLSLVMALLIWKERLVQHGRQLLHLSIASRDLSLPGPKPAKAFLSPMPWQCRNSLRLGKALSASPSPEPVLLRRACDLRKGPVGTFLCLAACCLMWLAAAEPRCPKRDAKEAASDLLMPCRSKRLKTQHRHQ